MTETETRAYWSHLAHAHDSDPVDLSLLDDINWANGWE